MGGFFGPVNITDTEYIYGFVGKTEKEHKSVTVKMSGYLQGRKKYIEYIKVSNSPKKGESAFYVFDGLSDESKKKYRKIGEAFLREERDKGFNIFVKKTGVDIHERSYFGLINIDNYLSKTLMGKNIKKKPSKLDKYLKV